MVVELARVVVEGLWECEGASFSEPSELTGEPRAGQPCGKKRMLAGSKTRPR